MQKRRSDDRNGGRAAKRRRGRLYLVFDDWLLGVSVRKLSDSDSDGAKEQLPNTVFRLEAQHKFSEHTITAFGSRIIAMPFKLPPNRGYSRSSPIEQVGELTFFNVRSRDLTFGPRPVVDLVNPIYIPTKDGLFVLSSNSFQVLNMSSVEEADGPCSWCELPLHPFNGDYVTSYAVHPNGTIFVSSKNLDTSSVATYTFDPADRCSGWKKHGDWALPFNGHAHFDPNLKAWVGISGDMDTTRYICACDVVSAKSDGGGGLCPSWKVSKEALFSEKPNEWHIGASLVFTGSRFCLVQCVSLNGAERLSDPPALSHCTVFRLMTFSLKYDWNGDLTTGNSRRLRYCKVPKAAAGYSLMKPLVFWL